MMFDSDKTMAFFGLATPFINRFRTLCESTVFDTPEAIANTLRPLVSFGLWNIPGLCFADGRLLDVDGNPMGRPDAGAHELLHEAIFRSEDSSSRYPLIDSGFSRGGITKLLMNVETAAFYPHPWLDPELLAQARACREEKIDLVELTHDGDYRYGEPAPAPLKAWAALAYAVIERLAKKSSTFKRANSHQTVEFNTLTAFVAPPEVTAKYFLIPYPDCDHRTWVHFEHFVTMAFDELSPPIEASPPVTGDYRDVPATSQIHPGASGNGHKSPSIATLAAAYGGTILHDSHSDPLREAFERSQLAPKFERELLQYGAPVVPSQVVTDTIVLVGQLVELGITADKALDAAVALLRPVSPPEGD